MQKILLLSLALLATSAHAGYLPATVALVQTSANAHFGKVAENTASLTSLANEAVRKGAKIILFPEGSTTGYEEAPHPDVTKKDRKRTWCAPGALTELTQRFRKDLTCVDPTPVAEPVPAGATTQYWAGYAMAHKVYIVFDMLELVEAGNPATFARTAVIVGPQGYIASHRKAKRWENEEYIGAVLGGPTVLETPYGRFGLAICSGVFANELFDAYQQRGLSAILFPAHWVPKNYPGFQGPSADSFDFLSKWRKFDFLAADDSGSARTGYYKADGTTRARLDRLGESAILFVEIAY